MITMTVYFHGPMTAWGKRVADAEVIARREFPFLWLARTVAKSIVSELDRGRCGYVLERSGEVVEHYEAPNRELS